MSKSATPTNESPVENWPIRECYMYKEEYQDCTSIKARFHQYFIYGNILDCSQWKSDYKNCCAWTEEGNKEACRDLEESEKRRFQERMRGHFRNNVWKKRTCPPDDWNKPLPEWLKKNYENTYLDLRSKQEQGVSNQEPDNTKMCLVS